MLNDEIINTMEKQIVKTLIDSLYKINKITAREYKSIINELITI